MRRPPCTDRAASGARRRSDPSRQDPKPTPIDLGEGARKRRRHRSHQIVHGARAPAPVDAPVLGPAPAIIGALRKIERARLCAACDQRRKAALQHPRRRLGHLERHGERILVLENGHRLLIDERAGVGLLDHGMQARAGLGLAVQDRPVHRRAAAVLRQQRAVHVEGAAGGQIEPLRLEQVAVVEREHEVRPAVATLGEELRPVRVRAGERMQAALHRELGDAAEPALLAGLVLVGEQQRDLDPLVQQLAHTANAHLAVGEHHRAGHCAGSSGAGGASSTASTR